MFCFGTDQNKGTVQQVHLARDTKCLIGYVCKMSNTLSCSQLSCCDSHMGHQGPGGGGWRCVRGLQYRREQWVRQEVLASSLNYFWQTHRTVFGSQRSSSLLSDTATLHGNIQPCARNVAQKSECECVCVLACVQACVRACVRVPGKSDLVRLPGRLQQQLQCGWIGQSQWGWHGWGPPRQPPWPVCIPPPCSTYGSGCLMIQ